MLFVFRICCCFFLDMKKLFTKKSNICFFFFYFLDFNLLFFSVCLFIYLYENEIVYDISGSTSDRNVVVLNDIYIDIMDYIIPATCSDAQFRQMWTEFEWENKVTVNTGINDLIEYLNHLIKSTNMKCLTPQKSLSGNCGFLAANLYAKSIFGEDALANVSIEKTSLDAPVTGHIRIRAKSQGMALSLGDKINTSQKMAKAA